MSNDKTLATAKHGGCVQLGQQDLSTSEGGRKFIAEYFTRVLHRHDFADYISTHLAADFACALAQHLSAQPSPGGQDTSELVYALPTEIANLDGESAVWVKRDAVIAALSAQPSLGGQGEVWVTDAMVDAALARYLELEPSEAENNPMGETTAKFMRQLLQAALAVRQPEVVDLPESLHDRVEALREVAARQPVGEPDSYQLWQRWTNSWVEISKQTYEKELRQGAYRVRALYAAPPAQQPAQAVDLGPASIPDTPEVRDILGRPNFWCSRWANVLRMRGDAIPRKAEEEQAAVIRFMLNHYLANGADWAETAGAELDAIRKADSQAVGNG